MAIPHGKDTRLLVDRYDLTSDGNEVTVSIDHPVADKTGFGVASKSFVSGQHSWKLDCKLWYNSQGTVSGAGSVQPAGTAGSDLALYYLSNLGTAPPLPDNVLGYFPDGCGTGVMGYAGIAGINGVTRTANVGNAVGITAGFVGQGPVTRITSLGERNVIAAGGSTGAIDIGTPALSGTNTGAYCYFWIIGTTNYIDGASTAAVYGTISASDLASSGYSDLALYSGTVAGAYAIQATVTAGSVPRFINFSYGIGGVASQGTIVAAIGRING